MASAAQKGPGPAAGSAASRARAKGTLGSRHKRPIGPPHVQPSQRVSMLQVGGRRGIAGGNVAELRPQRIMVAEALIKRDFTRADGTAAIKIDLRGGFGVGGSDGG